MLHQGACALSGGAPSLMTPHRNSHLLVDVQPRGNSVASIPQCAFFVYWHNWPSPFTNNTPHKLLPYTVQQLRIGKSNSPTTYNVPTYYPTRLAIGIIIISILLSISSSSSSIIVTNANTTIHHHTLHFKLTPRHPLRHMHRRLRMQCQLPHKHLAPLLRRRTTGVVRQCHERYELILQPPIDATTAGNALHEFSRGIASRLERGHFSIAEAGGCQCGMMGQ
mmetsp:Transcript_3446/g.6142  ORF Transcript_3446/g.6142 Transcript_3446/m.6142 type:complete len:222 (-) Transcript_3446:987-1652(-)